MPNNNSNNNLKRGNRRLYEEFLLNKWISIPTNQVKVVVEICKKNPNLLFNELLSILSFEPIIDFNPGEQIENSDTKRVKNQLIEYHKERTEKATLETLYERYVKDYLLKATVKTIFGVPYTVTLHCEVRSRLTSHYLTSRLSDLRFLYDDTNDDLRQQAALQR